MPNTSLSPSDAARIAQRYPKPRVPTWVYGTVAGIVAVCLAGYWVVVSWQNTAAIQFEGQLSSYRVDSPNSVSGLARVARHVTDVPGVCTVFVEAPDYERVGEIEIAVPPRAEGEDQVVEIPVEVRTVRPGLHMDIEKCRAA